MRNIYERAIVTLPADHIDHATYSSDLYIKKTLESAKLIAEYEFKSGVTTFVDNIDGCIWYDIPFAYDPFWSGIARKSAQLEGRP